MFFLPHVPGETIETAGNVRRHGKNDTPEKVSSQKRRNGEDMAAGFFYSILLGVAWACVGATVASARKEGCPVWSFYTVGTALAALLCWGGWILGAPGRVENGWNLFFCLAPSAFFNALGQALTMYNLKASGRALAYALPQTNFVFPFLFSVFFLGGVINPWNVIGLLLIVGGVFLSANLSAKRSGKDRVPGGVDALLAPRELLFGIAAAVSCGISQILVLLAETSSGTTSPLFKSALLLSASVIVYGLGAAHETHVAGKVRLRMLRGGVAWGFFAMCSYLLLFHALALMEEYRQSGIVFAIGCSVAVLLFWVYSVCRLRDRVSRRQLVVLCVILAGIIAVRLG